MRLFLRWILVAFVALGLLGAGVFAYKFLWQEYTFRVAVTSTDGDDAQAVQTIARWFASEKRRFRLKLIATGSTEKSVQLLQSRGAELALFRADEPQHKGIESIAVLFKELAVLGVPKGSTVSSWRDLKGKAAVVTGSTQVNDTLLKTMLRLHGAYDTKITYAAPDKVFEILNKQKAAQAMMLVTPLRGRSTYDLRKSNPTLQMKDVPKILEVEDTDVVTEQDKRYVEATIPAGALRSTPPVPSENITTLAVNRHIMVRREIPDALISRLLQQLLDARRALQAENPLIAQIAAPDLEKDAAVQVHSGARNYYNNEETSFTDFLSDWLYIAPMILGAVGSLIVGLFQFLKPSKAETCENLVSRLVALRRKVQAAKTPEDILAVEAEFEHLSTLLEEGLGLSSMEVSQSLALLNAIDATHKNIAQRAREIHGASAPVQTPPESPLALL